MPDQLDEMRQFIEQQKKKPEGRGEVKIVTSPNKRQRRLRFDKDYRPKRDPLVRQDKMGFTPKDKSGNWVYVWANDENGGQNIQDYIELGYQFVKPDELEHFRYQNNRNVTRNQEADSESRFSDEEGSVVSMQAGKRNSPMTVYLLKQSKETHEDDILAKEWYRQKREQNIHRQDKNFDNMITYGEGVTIKSSRG